MHSIRLLAAFATLWIGLRIYAQESWTLTTADFNTQAVSVTGIGNSSINILGANGAANSSVPLDSLLTLSRENPAPLPLAKWRIHLTGDQLVTGELAEMKGEDLKIKSAPLGTIDVPLKQIVAIVKANAQLGDLPENRTEDRITLNNGDVVNGIIAEITPASISIQRAGGETTAVPTDSIASVILAKAASDDASGARAFRVTLSDGTSVESTSVALEGSRVMVQVFNTKASIPVQAVKTIEQVNGPVVWLSSLTPQEDVQIPYYGDRARPAQRNESVLGQPIRVGSQVFAHGLGVHSRSKVTYAVDSSFKVFRTQYAIDGELPWADVSVRVLVDGKVAHEQKNVRAGKLSPVVSVDLKGAKTLTLEVDYGDNYDVQDRLNWIEPAFMR